MKHTRITSILAATAALFLCQCKGGGSGAADSETPTGGGGSSAGAAGGTPIAMEYPPEVIEGTIKAMSNIPNLVPTPKEPRKLLVPTGATLLSKGKKVTSSDDAPVIGTLELITDGDKQTNEGYFVELLDGLQWVQIDLDKTADVSAVFVWHKHSLPCVYSDVIIQVSDDPAFKTGVTTIFNNDYDKSAKMGLGKDYPYVESRFGLACDGMGAKGRYVRLYSSGNSLSEMNHYIEVEVYGIAK